MARQRWVYAVFSAEQTHTKTTREDLSTITKYVSPLHSAQQLVFSKSKSSTKDS